MGTGAIIAFSVARASGVNTTMKRLILVLIFALAANMYSGLGLASLQELFNMNKQLLAGLPFVVAFSSIDKICNAILSTPGFSGSPIQPNLDEIIVELRTSDCMRRSFTLPNASQLWQQPEFRPDKKTVVFVTGWFMTIDNNVVEDMSKSYICRGDTNFVAVSAKSLLNSLSTWSSFNTQTIGEYLARALSDLIQRTDLNNIHVIGHSLGGQIVGAVGRSFTQITGQKLPRITALDPANPCFSRGGTLTSIQQGDAEFIDVIHTNPGAIGEGNAVGDADFYIGNRDILPPGCLDILCAHFRVLRYYAESVYPGNEYDFVGRNEVDGSEVTMGFAVPPSARGVYLVNANVRPPYGTNSSDSYISPTDDSCGKCNN